MRAYGACQETITLKYPTAFGAYKEVTRVPFRGYARGVLETPETYQITSTY